MIQDRCQECGREMDRPENFKAHYCSFECACYAGRFSVSKGWKRLNMIRRGSI